MTISTLGISFTPSAPLAQEAVQFTGLWTGNAAPTSWLWDFGDGSTSTLQNPKHKYLSSGSMQITLSASGEIFGDLTAGPEFLNIIRILPYNQPMPWAGMQFKDNDGVPLSNGWVYSYGANGYQPQVLRPTYSDDGHILPNPYPLDVGGRMILDDLHSTADMTISWPYHFVAKTSNGTVTQELSNVYVPLYMEGTNISFSTRDTSVNQLQINSTTTDPLFGQGDSYNYTITSVNNSVFDGAPGDTYNIQLNTQKTNNNPVIAWDNTANAFKFLYDGAYEVTTNLTFTANTWPVSTVVVYGSILQRTIDTEPVNISYDSSYNTDSLSKSLTDTFCVSALKDQHMAMKYYAIGTDSSDVYSMAGSITITRIGDWFSQIVEPPVSMFTEMPTSGRVPLVVTFTDTSTNNPTSWLWDFGDGGTSTDQNPTYTYYNIGSYNVTLIASNRYGSGTPYILPVNATAYPSNNSYNLWLIDDTGTNIGIVYFTPTYEITEPYVEALCSLLNGYPWPQEGGSPMAFFNNPPEPESATTLMNTGHNLFYQDNQYVYGRTLYLQLAPAYNPPVWSFAYDVAYTNNADQQTENIEFYVDEGQTIVCGTQGLMGVKATGNTFIRLFDPAGNNIISNDDAPAPYNYPNEYASWLTTVALTSGNYVLKVGAFAMTRAYGIAGVQVF